MKNKLQSKVAVALLTTMLATSAAPVFAANNNGRIDNFYIYKNSSKIVEEQPVKFLIDEENRTARFYELSNGQRSADIRYLSSGKNFFRHGEYIDEYLSGNHSSIAGVLEALKVVKTDELKQYSGKFYQLNHVGTNKFNYTKIADPFDGNVDPENPDKPDTGGETTDKEEVIKKIKDAKNYENEGMYIELIKLIDAKNEYDNYVKEHKAIKENYLAKLETHNAKAIWQIFTKRDAEEEFKAASAELGDIRKNIKKSRENYNEVLESYNIISKNFENKIVDIRKDIDNNLDEKDKADLSNELLEFYKMEQRVYIRRAQALNKVLNYEKLEKEIGFALNVNKIAPDETQIAESNKVLNGKIKEACIKNLKIMNNKGVAHLREEDEMKIRAIEKQYELYKADGENVVSLDYEWTIAKKLFDLNFVDFDAKITTPTAETIQWFRRLRNESKLIKKWTADLTKGTADKFEVNGLERIVGRAPADENILIEIPEKIKSDNKLYIFFTWGPNDKKNITSDNMNDNEKYYYKTRLTNKKETNEIAINYSILSIIDLSGITNLKNAQDLNDKNSFDESLSVENMTDGYNESNDSDKFLDEEKSNGTLSDLF